MLPIQYVDLGECLYYVAIQNLDYESINIHLTTSTNIETPLTHHIQHPALKKQSLILLK